MICDWPIFKVWFVTRGFNSSSLVSRPPPPVPHPLPPPFPHPPPPTHTHSPCPPQTQTLINNNQVSNLIILTDGPIFNNKSFVDPVLSIMYKKINLSVAEENLSILTIENK